MHAKESFPINRMYVSWNLPESNYSALGAAEVPLNPG